MITLAGGVFSFKMVDMSSLLAKLPVRLDSHQFHHAVSALKLAHDSLAAEAIRTAMSQRVAQSVMAVAAGHLRGTQQALSNSNVTIESIATRT